MPRRHTWALVLLLMAAPASTPRRFTSRRWYEARFYASEESSARDNGWSETGSFAIKSGFSHFPVTPYSTLDYDTYRSFPPIPLFGRTPRGEYQTVPASCGNSTPIIKGLPSPPSLLRSPRLSLPTSPYRLLRRIWPVSSSRKAKMLRSSVTASRTTLPVAAAVVLVAAAILTVAGAVAISFGVVGGFRRMSFVNFMR